MVSGDSNGDLEQIKLKQGEITDASLDSTRRMLTMATETQDVGVKTIDMLDQQADQLNRIDAGMDNVNSQLKEAERHITGMEKCCGLCVLPWKKRRNTTKEEGQWSTTDSDKTSSKSRVISKQPGPSSSGQATGPLIERITNDAREDEMEENMQQVSSIIGNLKNMAIDMGTEIESSNKQIDRINTKATTNEYRIGGLNKRTDQLLK